MGLNGPRTCLMCILYSIHIIIAIIIMYQTLHSELFLRQIMNKQLEHIHLCLMSLGAHRLSSIMTCRVLNFEFVIFVVVF